MTWLIIGSTLGVIIALGIQFILLKRVIARKSEAYLTERANLDNQLNKFNQTIIERLHDSEKAMTKRMHEDHLQGVQHTQTMLQGAIKDLREQLAQFLAQHGKLISDQVSVLTARTDDRLKDISGAVEKRLQQGFEKTTQTFQAIIERLTIIDEAQKKMSELSGHVVSLQEVFIDKRARGAFGEIQLATLIRNMLPEEHFALQHTLSNGKRADCMLFLPEPSGNIAIDAKFPLESFRELMRTDLTEQERKTVVARFRQDILKHIQAIAEKYIIQGETMDGAMMFIPAEAVFAEIHAHFPDLIDKAHQARVWLVSPTTLMAVLTTAQAALKDAATRKQVHVIQEHLAMLAKDFGRFEKRMHQLSRHIDQAHEDVHSVHTSARKITSRFAKIEKVELEALEDETLDS